MFTNTSGKDQSILLSSAIFLNAPQPCFRALIKCTGQGFVKLKGPFLDVGCIVALEMCDSEGILLVAKRRSIPVEQTHLPT